jgi:hypothetical protein
VSVYPQLGLKKLHPHQHIPYPNLLTKRKSSSTFQPQPTKNTSCFLALETSCTYTLAQNYQTHHRELWGLPDSQLWPPTPISESNLAGKGIQFPTHSSQRPQYPSFPASQSQPPACCPPPWEMGPRDSSQGQESWPATEQGEGRCQLNHQVPWEMMCRP